MSTILTTVTAKVLTAAVVVASATYVVAEVVAQDVPVTPTEIAVAAKAGSVATGADAIRPCGGNGEGSEELCITPDGLISDPGRALTTTGEALSESLRSADAIAEAIREGLNDVAAAPLSTGPNGRAS